jgi:hypothetical protein
VQDHVIVHARDYVARESHPDQDSLPALDSVNHFMVRRVDTEP